MSRRERGKRWRPGDPDRPGHADAGPGRRLGVDVGSVRVGLALSDPGPVLATPLTTLARDEAADRDIDQLGALVAEHGVVEVVVGLPRTLAGDHGASADYARRYAAKIAERVTPVPVKLADERLTTVSATRMLSDLGVRGRRQRQVIDQAAATEILQGWLDARAAALRPQPDTCEENS
ncbi:Holliday junction resolvase RuvX [Actinoalloteichus sp. AHMU CJ021]|uniref:Putative pre-16S rRNA nuclease n=1 Tax=Actinoalloteichus caeruleus DSM 43889 TaxID=1120930 RepID=A0ABT1JI75_ACTCY|nr:MULTISPECIES: Holliday junction resolvase RuvX [Actinoalloteichus]AUS77584.1 Holliday junction resolvase RuvX [Actinoalloteichus sp. AHMU CJ021]MCP2331466.1 putative holliday junction resolvase [Actinoalloteichus caeruleus DSM 43889]